VVATIGAILLVSFSGRGVSVGAPLQENPSPGSRSKARFDGPSTYHSHAIWGWPGDDEHDYSHEPKFTEAVTKKFYYGPVYFESPVSLERDSPKPYMTLSVAGLRLDAGVSIAEVSLKLVWDMVSQIKVGEHGQSYVIDADSRLIAHPDKSLVLSNADMTQLAQVRAARTAAVSGGEPVQEAKDILGRDVLTAFAPVMPLGWLVFVEIPIEEAK